MNPPPNIVDLAVAEAVRSPCRSKRGAVIFLGEIPLAAGFNYKPDCDGSAQCKATCGKEAVHAEQSALLSLPWGTDSRGLVILHVKVIDGKPVPGGPPSCVQCSKLIRHVDLDWVWLLHESGWWRYGAEEFHRLSVENSCSK